MPNDNSIEIRGLDKILNKLNAVSVSFDKDVSKALRLAAWHGIDIIKKRTSEGKAVEDKPFKPYSISYANYRKKLGAPTDKVDLRLRGNMMAAMTVKERKNEAILGFSSQIEADKAYRHNEGIRVKKRVWFAFSGKDRKAIVNVFKKDILETIIRKTE